MYTFVQKKKNNYIFFYSQLFSCLFVECQLNRIKHFSKTITKVQIIIHTYITAVCTAIILNARCKLFTLKYNGLYANTDNIVNIRP